MTRKAPTFLPPHAWAVIKQRAAMGEHMTRLAREFGLSLATVRARATREKWDTPARRRQAGRINGSRCDDGSATPGAGKESQSRNIHPEDAGSQAASNLQQALESGDAGRVKRALTLAVRDLVGRSLPALRAAGSPNESARLLGALARLEGWDSRQQAGDTGALIRPLAAVTTGRRPATDPEPEVDPFDGL